MNSISKKKLSCFFSFLLICSFGFIPSCKKADSPNLASEKKSMIEKRFFSNRTSNEEIVQIISAKIERANQKFQFVEKVVSKVGYPLWDKSIIQFVNKKSKKGASLNQDLILSIPFVRENENYVNAEMVVKVVDDDTLFKWRCDWEYQNYQHGPLSDTSSSEYYALTHMIVNYCVFGDSVFKLTDTSLFNSSIWPKTKGIKLKANTSNQQYQGRSNILNAPLPDNCVYTTGLDEHGGVIATGIFCLVEEGPTPQGSGILVIYSGGGTWWYFDESGGGGTGGPNSNGGGFIPPDCGPPVALRGASNFNCGPGYTIYPDLTLTAQLNIAQAFFGFQKPGDILIFDNTINPSNSQYFSSVAAFEEYRASNFPLNPTSDNSIPPTNISPSEKIVHSRFNLSFLGGVDVSCKISKTGSVWELSNVTSTEYGVSFGWSWDQLDYSKNVVGNEIIIVCEGYIRYNIFIEGIGTIFKDRRKFEITINNQTGVITKSKQL